MTPSQKKVLSVCNRNPKTGLTRRQIEPLADLGQGSVCARVHELMIKGSLEPNGMRYCDRAGRQVEVVRIAQ